MNEKAPRSAEAPYEKEAERIEVAEIDVSDYIVEDHAPTTAHVEESVTIETGCSDISSRLTNTERTSDELRDLPIIDSSVFKDAERGLGETPEFAWAATDKIVGRQSSKQWEDGWAHEYGARIGRGENVADAIRSGDEVKIENVFHFTKPSERIKLAAYDGPAGPLYDAQDGTHRVAGAMRAGLTEIPASIQRVTFPFSYQSTDAEEVSSIRKKIALGMIEGTVTETTDEQGVPQYSCTITNEVLPWLHSASQNAITRASKMYERVYPGSLDTLPIPRDVLVDPIANNYFMAGRWNEWEERFREQPRDEYGIVTYT